MQTLYRSPLFVQSHQRDIERHSPSVLVSACIVFLFLNLAFYWVDCRCVLTEKIKNAVNFDFPAVRKIGTRQVEKKANEITLLGSSLMIYPIWDLDRVLGVHCGDPNHYHSAIYMERKLKAITSSDWSVCNLGVGAAMVSDYFLLLSQHLRQMKAKPEWVVVDCAPRSFYDSGVNAANGTPVFDFFYTDKDLLSSSKYFLPDINSYLNFIVEHHCYLYKNRRWFLDALLKCMGNLQSIKKNNLVSNMNNTMQVSLKEYSHRYFGISPAAIKTQAKFLELIVQLCREQGIKVVIVNMPRTAYNQNLLKEDFYCYYLSCLKAIGHCKEHNIFFVDFNSYSKFRLSDFNDSVHLNAKGAVKLEDEIVNFISRMSDS